MTRIIRVIPEHTYYWEITRALSGVHEWEFVEIARARLVDPANPRRKKNVILLTFFLVGKNECVISHPNI